MNDGGVGQIVIDVSRQTILQSRMILKFPVLKACVVWAQNHRMGPNHCQMNDRGFERVEVDVATLTLFQSVAEFKKNTSELQE